MTYGQPRELEAAGEAAEARRGGACEGSAETSSGHWPSVRGNPDTGGPRNLTQVLSRVSPELSITTDYL